MYNVGCVGELESHRGLRLYVLPMLVWVMYRSLHLSFLHGPKAHSCVIKVLGASPNWPWVEQFHIFPNIKSDLFIFGQTLQYPEVMCGLLKGNSLNFRCQDQLTHHCGALVSLWKQLYNVSRGSGGALLSVWWSHRGLSQLTVKGNSCKTKSLCLELREWC